MIEEFDVILPDGRTLHGYDSGAGRLAVMWHHGTPNIGAPPAPLFEAAERLGIRWLAFDRPAYGTSTPLPGRDIASAARFAAAVADARGIGRFATVGHSGGGSHALACAALLPGRVTAAVAMAAVAPFEPFHPSTASPSSSSTGSSGGPLGGLSDGVPAGLWVGADWFAGMADGGVAALSAAVEGREARRLYAENGKGDDAAFTEADLAMFDGPWGWFGGIVEAALRDGPDGQVDDDVAYVTPWGCDPAAIRCPVLLVHGGADRMVPPSHSARLAARIPGAELWERPDDGHISVLTAGPAALAWLAAHS